MKIEWFATEGVDADGHVAAGGHVCVDGAVRKSPPEGGCGMAGCNCSAGYWISRIYPRTPDGIVAGFQAHFATRADLESVSLEDVERTAALCRQ